MSINDLSSLKDNSDEQPPTLFFDKNLIPLPFFSLENICKDALTKTLDSLEEYRFKEITEINGLRKEFFIWVFSTEISQADLSSITDLPSAYMSSELVDIINTVSQPPLKILWTSLSYRTENATHLMVKPLGFDLANEDSYALLRKNLLVEISKALIDTLSVDLTHFEREVIISYVTFLENGLYPTNADIVDDMAERGIKSRAGGDLAINSGTVSTMIKNLKRKGIPIFLAKFRQRRI